jgi:sugar/nucleoside kinase (ribokinase family)
MKLKEKMAPKLLGIGNALVDIMTRLDHDDYLSQFGLPKGSMTLVDAEKSKAVYEGTEHLPKTMRSGGSAANTIHGAARLGVESAFLGKIGRDKLGQVFLDDMASSGIIPKLIYSETETGRAIALVSPDTERTFATYLGAAAELDEHDMAGELFKGYQYFHIEGYLVQNQRLLKKTLETARSGKMIVSLDMASYNVVEANKDFLKGLVKKYVDILFANEEESRVFTGKEPTEAVEIMGQYCRVAVVKTGGKGSLVRKNGRTYPVGILPVKSVDTTGAGDLYASGFLYGMINNQPVRICGRIGAILAGKVIEVIGPKIPDDQWQGVRAMVAAEITN